MTENLMLGIVGAIQVLGTGWLHYQGKRNIRACGGPDCLAAQSKDALQSKSKASSEPVHSPGVTS